MQVIHQISRVLIEPSAVFAALKTAPGWRWTMLLLQAITAAILLWWFYQGMSANHIVEQQLLLAGDMTPAEQQQSRAILAQMAGNMPLIAPAMAAVMSVVVSLVFALYFLVASRFAKQFSVGDWLVFASWVQAPQLVNWLGFAVLVLLSASSDLPLTLTNYASLNQLATLSAPGDRSFNLLENLNLFYLWQLALTTVGLQQWLGVSRRKAFTLAVLPFAVVFGLWTLAL